MKKIAGILAFISLSAMTTACAVTQQGSDDELIHMDTDEAIQANGAWFDDSAPPDNVDVELSAIRGTPIVALRDQAALAAKDEAARSSLELPTASLQCPDGDCSSLGVIITQQPQQTSGYCGPATLSEIVAVRGVNISQATAAAALHYAGNGTDWCNGTNCSNHPMEVALEAYLPSANYIPVALPGSPSATDLANYKSRIVADVRNNWAIAGDAYEVVGGNHLVGHPNRNIFHWFAIYGYGNWGAQTWYADSASGASSISWSSSVPRYSVMNSDVIVKILGGRGYVW